MKVKTSELIKPALDWAVATILGYSDLRVNPHKWDNGLVMTPPHAKYGPVYLSDISSSTYWEICGPIIEREKIDIEWVGREWVASVNAWTQITGPTPLIAAMRCFVASKLGEEVEIPNELI